MALSRVAAQGALGLSPGFAAGCVILARSSILSGSRSFSPQGRKDSNSASARGCCALPNMLRGQGLAGILPVALFVLLSWGLGFVPTGRSHHALGTPLPVFFTLVCNNRFTPQTKTS